MADATPKPAPRRSIAKRFALMAAVLASAILIYGGAQVTRTVHLMIESEKNLQSTLYTFAIVEQFVKTERRWPRSWRELERVVMPVEPGQREFAVPYQMSMTEVQQRVIVDFEAGIDVMISDSSQNFTAIRPNGASYPYDKGQIAVLLAELRAIVGERTPAYNASMRADIGDPEDSEKMNAFARVLHQFCAVQTNEGWGVGVSVTEYRIGDQKINVFRDSWSVDIEGPDALVRGIQEAMRLESTHRGPGNDNERTGP